MNEYEEEAWLELEAKQFKKKVDNINKILNLIEGGSLAEGEKASDLIKEILEMQKDAMRHRWLTKYTCQLFMVTERQMNDQIDAAMTGVRK
jgi:RecJ-like exonuclease